MILQEEPITTSIPASLFEPLSFSTNMLPRTNNMEEAIQHHHDEEEHKDDSNRFIENRAPQPREREGFLTTNKGANAASTISHHSPQELVEEVHSRSTSSRSILSETTSRIPPEDARLPAVSSPLEVSGRSTIALSEASLMNASSVRTGDEATSCHHDDDQVIVVEATFLPRPLMNESMPTEACLSLAPPPHAIHSSPVSHRPHQTWSESAPTPPVPLLDQDTTAPLSSSAVTPPPLQVAMQLNNMAVAMMSRQCWTQAQATLQEALSMLGTIRRPADTQQPSTMSAACWAPPPPSLTTSTASSMSSSCEVPVATPTLSTLGASTDVIHGVTASVWQRSIEPLPVPNLGITVNTLKVSLRSSLRSRPVFGSQSSTQQHLYHTHTLNDEEPWILYPLHFEEDEDEIPKEETAMMLGEDHNQIDEDDEEEDDDDDDPLAEVEMAVLLYNAAVVSLGLSKALKRRGTLPVEAAQLRQSAVHLLKMADAIGQECWDLYSQDLPDGDLNDEEDGDYEGDQGEGHDSWQMEEEGDHGALPQAIVYPFNENEGQSYFWGASQQPLGMDHPHVVVPVEFAPYRYRILMVQMMAVGQLIPLLYKLGLEQQVRDMESKLNILQDHLQTLEQDLMEIDDL